MTLHRKNETFFSIIHRITNKISASISMHDLDSRIEARQRTKLERPHTMPTISYGRTTIWVNDELYDMPTLAYESGLQPVCNASRPLESDNSDLYMIQFGRKCEPEDDIQPPPYTTINGLSA
jgi:hypothetical protein